MTRTEREREREREIDPFTTAVLVNRRTSYITLLAILLGIMLRAATSEDQMFTFKILIIIVIFSLSIQ